MVFELNLRVDISIVTIQITEFLETRSVVLWQFGHHV